MEKIDAYHGTSTLAALKMARDGHILSPWDNEISLLKSRGEDVVRMLVGSPESKDLEEYAFEIACVGYQDREIEHRVKCASLGRDLQNAKGYAKHFENYEGGGIVLKLNIPRSMDGETSVIFVPRRISLDFLTDIYMLPRSRDYLEDMKEAYAHYSPAFWFLD